MLIESELAIEPHQTSFCRDFWLIYKRFMMTYFRNKQTSVAFIFIALMMAFLEACLFYNMGTKTFFPGAKGIQLTQNYVGLAFMLTFDAFSEMDFAQVTIIPLNYNLFTREIGNRMYNPSAYFLAQWLSAISIFILYPIVNVSGFYFFIRFQGSSFQNYLSLVGAACLLGVCGMNFGLMLSTFLGNPDTALVVNSAIMSLFGMGAGIVVHTGGDQTAGFMWFNHGLMYLSPWRYGCELVLRCMLSDVKHGELLLENLSYTFGSKVCALALAGYALLYMLIGWAVLLYRSR
jgi:hypothetical protein